MNKPTPAEQGLKAALRASMAINGDPFKKEGPMPEDDTEQLRLPRVTLDFKIPLWGIVCAGTGLVWSLVAMYFQLAQVSSQMVAMQELLKANNAAMVQLTSEQVLLKYRIEKLESGAKS